MTALPAERFAAKAERLASVVTAATLFEQRAARRPQAAALADQDDRAHFGFPPGRSYSYGEAQAAIGTLCRFFGEQGLEPGDILGLHMPNVAETVLLYLAAWRYGLTVASFPYLWRELEIAEACAAIEPAGLIGGGLIDKDNLAETLRDVAAMHLSIRLVAGFGENLPEGVADLAALLGREPEDEDVPPPPQHSYAPALITFTARAGIPLVPVPHSMDALLAQGAMAVLALGLQVEDRILNAYPLSGPAGLGLGLMPWLVSGGTLIQHQPFVYEAFAGQLLSSGASVTALPPAYVAELVHEGVLKLPDCRLRRLARVFFGCQGGGVPAVEIDEEVMLFDAHALGDLALLLLTHRHDARLVPRGRLALSAEASDSMVFVETALRESGEAQAGEMLLRGPAVPKGFGSSPIRGDAEGYVRTGLTGSPEAAAEPLLRLGCDGELVHHGGFTMAAAELDALYRGFPAADDAAAFTRPDPHIGDRIFAAIVPKPGQNASQTSLGWYLKTRKAAAYKHPEAVLQVARIPRGADGRILREELARQLAETAKRRAG